MKVNGGCYEIPEIGTMADGSPMYGRCFLGLCLVIGRRGGQLCAAVVFSPRAPFVSAWELFKGWVLYLYDGGAR